MTSDVYNNEMQYLSLLKRVLNEGEKREDRTGTGTVSIFGAQMHFDLTQGFPLLTTKRVHWRSVVGELLWFLRGDTNTKWLNDNGIRIWDEWADKDGDLGPVYGWQWRNWSVYNPYFKDNYLHIDQVKRVIEDIKFEPRSRRHIVSAWNVGELTDMALPPCHLLFQFYVREGKYLDCQLYQRSADMFLGVPFNIASYSLLTHMIAQVTGLTAGRFVHTLGDAHIYNNHVDQVREQLSRGPRQPPRVLLNEKVLDIDGFDFDDITLVDYVPHAAIKGKVAV